MTKQEAETLAAIAVNNLPGDIEEMRRKSRKVSKTEVRDAMRKLTKERMNWGRDTEWLEWLSTYCIATELGVYSRDVTPVLRKMLPEAMRPHRVETRDPLYRGAGRTWRLVGE